jgi:RND family efflux transporter MFP subunit
MDREKHKMTYQLRIFRHELLLSAALLALLAESSAGAQYEGFTEPYQSIALASSESGVVTVVNVHVGDRVKSGQVLVELEKDIQQANLRIAEQAINARGAIDLALAERELHKGRLKKLETLLVEGDARQEEVDRTRADLAIAEAKLETSEEDLAMKKQEYDRARLCLERRSIRAPQDGAISDILKDPGEFIAANDPVILNLAQLDPLLAVFNLPSSQAAQLKVGQKAVLSLPNQKETAEGSVETISPLTDAESGTTRVKIRIANPDGRYRGGERCLFDMPPDRNDEVPRAKSTPAVR